MRTILPSIPAIRALSERQRRAVAALDVILQRFQRDQPTCEAVVYRAEISRIIEDLVVNDDAGLILLPFD